MRYAVYDPNDPRKGKILPDPVLGQIILGEGRTITNALAAAGAPPPGTVVWDREQKRVAYTVPDAHQSTSVSNESARKNVSRRGSVKAKPPFTKRK